MGFWCFLGVGVCVVWGLDIWVCVNSYYVYLFIYVCMYCDVCDCLFMLLLMICVCCIDLNVLL